MPGLMKSKRSVKKIFFRKSKDFEFFGGKHDVFLGKTHSHDTRKKMSDTHKLRMNGVGEKNSQFGTKWVNKSGLAKKIKAIDLDDYLANGWAVGRK